MPDASLMDAVQVTRHGTVALVTLRNDAGYNSFDPVLLRHLRSVFHGLLEDPDVRALVLTGSGKVFSTGADVKAMQQAAQEGKASQWVLDATAQLHPLMLDLHASAKPFLAAVNGVAAGGGLGLALVADARIGAPEARFAAGYFGIGLSPDGGATWLLPRLIGMQRTRRFFFDNEVMDADEAHRIGLLDRIVPTEGLVDETVRMAKRWGAWGVHSRGATKRLLATSLDTDFAAQLDLERGSIASAAGTKDFREGTTAFVARRSPVFE